MNKALILIVSTLLVSVSIVSGLRLRGQPNGQQLGVNVVEESSFDGNFGPIDDNDQDDGDNEDDIEYKPMNDLARSCFYKLLTSPSVKCIAKSMAKWKVSWAQTKSIHNSRSVCCAIWQMTGCMISNTQDTCTREERSEFLDHMSVETERRNRRNCSRIPYNDNDCTAGPMADTPTKMGNNYYSDVMYRRNNRFINDNELRQQLNEDELPSDEPINQHNDDKHLQLNQFDNDNYDQKRYNPQDSTNNELSLAHKLLDRIDTITVNQFIINLHPIKHKSKQHKHIVTDHV